MSDAGNPRSTAAAAGFALLALLGQLSLLLLTHAGKDVGYQHFTPLAAQGLLHAAQVVLAAQVVIVAIALTGRRAEMVRIIRTLLPGWRLPVALVLFVAASSALSREPGALVTEFTLAPVAQLAQLATVVLFVVSLPSAAGAGIRGSIDRLLGPSGDATPAGTDRLAIVLALWTVAVSYLLAVLSYERIPHIPDEVVYLLHARYFAASMLSMPAPPVPAAFNIDLMTYDPTRWFSPVPPGWPAALSLGVRAGVPWLVNPLLAGLNVLLASALLRSLYPRRTVRLILLLLAASPWALFMAMNVLTHTFATSCALGAALCVARLRSGRSLAWAVPGGALIGVISLIRPLEGLAVALLLGIWSLPARWRAIPLLPSATLTLSTVVVGLINLPYNRLLTGNARLFPLVDYSNRVWGPGKNDLGFGPDRGVGWGLDPFPGHGLRDVIVNNNLNMFQVNIELLGWGCGALVAVWLLLACGRLRRSDWMMLAVIAMIVGLHAFYWFSGGPDFGARYWYLILVPMLALVARGIEETDATVRAAGSGDGAGVFGVAAACVILAMVVFMPWRAADKYRHYRGMRPDVRALAREHRFGRSLVLVRGNRQPDYHGAATFNPVDLHADAPVFAWDQTPAIRNQVLAAYHDRPVWILDGPSVTHGGYRIVAGPITADAAAARPLLSP